MHKKNAARGLVVITVSVDELTNKEHVEAAKKFLREQKPPFTNLLLDEPHELWSKKLGFTIPPGYFVFDRQGKWARFTGDDLSDDELHKALEKTVMRMLDEK